MLRVAALVFALAYPQPTAAASDHPIAGVISLLQKLEVQSKEEGAAEAASFQKFTYWCKTSQKTLSKAIKTEKREIASLTDKIDGLTADISTLGEDIDGLKADIEKMETSAEGAKAAREKENGLYEEEQKNFGDTIAAVDEALTSLKDSKSSLLQTSTNMAVEKAKALAQKARVLAMAMGKPEAKTYSFKSGGIIETFKAMKAEFEADKLDSTTAETNKLNAYNLAKQARDTTVSSAKDSKKEKEDIKGDKEADKANAETSKSEASNALADDTATLEQTDKECKTVTGEWQERSEIREGEIKAMEMASKILSKVTGVRNPDTHEIPAKALMEASSKVEQDTASYGQRTAISFLQLEDPKTKAVNLLKTAASKAHSKALEKLAAEIATYDGPFDKIKQMIQKMIFRLMAEQKDEDDHKNWCDLETEKSTESKEDKDEKMNMLKKKVEEHNAAIMKLMKEITENNDKASELTKHMEEETELRNENHAEIVATIKDSQDAQAAVTQATQVLKDFYKKSGMIAKEPWEFVQVSSHRGVDLPKSPSTWDSSYTGVTDPKNGADGVLALLDGVLQKFSAMEADAKVQDGTDQKNYESDMQASKISLEETKQDSQMKTTKKDSMQEKMEGLQGGLKHTTTEFNAVVQYLKDLQPACGEGDATYADRKQARSDEITALRKAQGILEDAFRAKAL